MRIKCPECGGVLSFAHAKPGHYRPKCKHCQQTFRLKITDDDPPRFGVGRIPAESAAANKPANGRNAASNVGTDATVEVSAIEATFEESRENSESPQATDSSQVSPLPGDAPPHSHRSDDSETLPIDSDGIPDRLGGYRILRLIGKGAMGSVYQAKQVSLDRLVALKTIRGRLAENPASLARFAREAYAAAQLAHHNVVQIYDFGEDAGRYFFSMEWVRGGPLDRLIREKGAIDPKLAAGYTLQAARGLQYAHRNGMVHRDIKPANLLLSDDGVIKVADLGLVKIPDAVDSDLDARSAAVSGMVSGTQVTMQGTAVGTPAYMAPEQGNDAATVDHRADIYSLGCSLYCMLTGHPPFEGKDVSEVMEQHARLPFPNLKQANARIPAALERVVLRATAKRPSDRYASISGMIEDLESFLGVRSDGDFSPTKAQADTWDGIATSYRDAAPALRVARPLISIWAAICFMLTVVIPFFGINWWMFGPSMWVATLTIAPLLAAHSGRSAVTTKFRAWLESMSWTDWVIGLSGIAIGFLLMIMLSWWPGCLVGTLIGCMVAAAYHFLLVLPAHTRRAAPLQQAERFVRDLRIDGADEQGLRQFIARYSGQRWQGIFEDLFGYDALCQLRERLAVDPSVSASMTSMTPRDKFCRWLTTRTKANLEARDRRRLARIEQRGLASEGVSSAEARERAWQIAAAIMENARSVPVPSNVASQGQAEAIAVQEKRARMKAMLADARSGRYRKKRDPRATLKFAFSGQTRLVAGCLLLAWFAARGHQEGIFDAFKNLDASQLDLDQVGSVIRDVAVAASDDLSDSTDRLQGSASTWSLGIAGLFMAMSSFVSGWRMTPFAVVATLVILLGSSLGIPEAGPLPSWIVSALVGLVIYVPGILFGETKDDRF